MDSPAIQHWLVAVARAARLEGADALEIPSDVPIANAWEIAERQTGLRSEELARRVADHYRLEVADLQGADPHARRLLPGRVARKLGVLPLRYSDRSLAIATSDPVGMEAERQVSSIAGRVVHFEIAAPASLGAAIDETYPRGEPQHEVPALAMEPSGGPRILVVDDEEAHRLLLRTVLQQKGFRVTEAADGPEALEILAESEPFDLVTLDIYMDGMHGLDVLKRIRSQIATADLPVVVATSADDAELEMKLFEAGADDYVVKPVDPPRFVLRIQAVLRRRQRGWEGFL